MFRCSLTLYGHAPNFRWSDLRRDLERLRKAEERRRAQKQLADVERTVAAILPPEERRKLFVKWKAELYERGRR